MVKNLIVKALAKAVNKTTLDIESPETDSFGDYSSNIALVSAKSKGKNPRELAQEITEKLRSDNDLKDVVEKIEVAGPGFINFYLSKNIPELGRATQGVILMRFADRDDSVASVTTLEKAGDEN